MVNFPNNSNLNILFYRTCLLLASQKMFLFVSLILIPALCSPLEWLVWCLCPEISMIKYFKWILLYSVLTLFFHLQTDNKMQPSIAKRFTFFRYTKYICWKSIFFVIKTLNLPKSEIFGCKVFICETELHNKCFPKIIVTSGIILGCYSFKNCELGTVTCILNFHLEANKLHDGKFQQ